MNTEQSGRGVGRYGDELAESISMMLGPMLNRYRQNIDKLVQPYGFSAGQVPLILLLSERDGQTQKELARQMEVTPASLTSMLGRVEKTGLVVRRRSDTDHRTIHVHLTVRGRNASKRLGAIIRFVNARNLAGFRTEEKILFQRFMVQMDDNMKTHREELDLLDEQDYMLVQFREARKKAGVTPASAQEADELL